MAENDAITVEPIHLQLALHPSDFAIVQAAAQYTRMAPEDFCSLAVYRMARTTVADAAVTPAPCAVMPAASGA